MLLRTLALATLVGCSSSSPEAGAPPPVTPHEPQPSVASDTPAPAKCVLDAPALAPARVPILGDRGTMQVVEGMVPIDCIEWSNDAPMRHVGGRWSCFTLDRGAPEGTTPGQWMPEPGQPSGMYLEVTSLGHNDGGDFEAEAGRFSPWEDSNTTSGRTETAAWATRVLNHAVYDHAGIRAGGFIGFGFSRVATGEVVIFRLSSVEPQETDPPPIEGCGSLMAALAGSIAVETAATPPGRVALASFHVDVPDDYVVDHVEDMEHHEVELRLEGPRSFRTWYYHSTIVIALRGANESELSGDEEGDFTNGRVLGRNVRWFESGDSLESHRAIEIHDRGRDGAILWIEVLRHGDDAEMAAQWTRAEAILATLGGTFPRP